MDTNKLSSLSQTDTDEKIGEFWDNHDFTEFDNLQVSDVEIEIGHTVRIEMELFNSLEKQAQKRGVQLETLVNLWLQEKLAEAEVGV